MEKDIRANVISSIVIPIAALILTAVVTQLIKTSLIFTIHLSITVALLVLVLSILRQKKAIIPVDSHKSFLRDVYSNRNAASEQQEIDAILNAERSVKVLGISHKILWSNQTVFRDVLVKSGLNDVKLTFLILDSNGSNLEKKAVDEGEEPDIWRNDISASMARFKDLKARNPQMDLEVFMYDVFPIWHMVIIDDKIGYIGYYPTNRSASHAPLYVMERHEDKYSLLNPLIKYFDNLRSNGRKVV